MARPRTPGIRMDRNGGRIIDKEHRGKGIYLRLGPISQEHAEQRLADEIARANAELERNASPRRRFADCAARYLEQSKNKRSVGATAWHVRLLTSYIGNLDVHRIHDGTLETFVADRLASGVTATTINRSLEVVRTILNRAARSYRDDEGRPWLETMPPLITMLPEMPRAPYPITDEQDRLFSMLPARLARMVLFAINTGLRESNVCGLEWGWEVAVPEVGRSVFVIPPEAFKSKRAHVVILNDVAWSIIETQRGLHPLWVFPYRGKQVSTMNNTAWQRARREEGLQAARIHDKSLKSGAPGRT
jgi:integrase